MTKSPESGTTEQNGHGLTGYRANLARPQKNVWNYDVRQHKQKAGMTNFAILSEKAHVK